ncbi:CinA family protein [Helicobacter sp. 11S03491-1]|uniref:CinA family protein n=1 Tax=Helicobacter sp. 11S03491-1 TaxID=1476196 RepID=UPI000BA51B9C|nr:CinA family protein [Helicobacter sp. 11S03491-1]PAF43412.1 hypothetical protein BKH45_01905 [Helicobacter sp. 11S03491-1]
MEFQSLNVWIMETLKSKNKKVTTAESCTGGLLAYQFTSIGGASDIYEGGIISYGNEIKHRYLKVKNESLKKYGAVSAIVVEDMLLGALEMFGADYAIATSGIAGPGGGSLDKPVGTVYIGVQEVGKKPSIEKFLFAGDRRGIQEQSCKKALEILARNL